MDWKAAIAGAACVLLGTGALAQSAATRSSAGFGSHKPSADARAMADWALASGDSEGRPFVVVDKKDARIYLFEGSGQLAGASAALLGSARGDSSNPGVGQRAQTGEVAAKERTTPAGRFVSTPGRNLQGEQIVWVDYASAFAIHRVRPGAARERREARLATRSPDDNRVSLGCVVVPVAFYEAVVQPLLGSRHGVVYVLPETTALREVFSAL